MNNTPKTDALRERERRADIRLGGSYHVEYVLDDDDETYETRNLTHVETGRPDSDEICEVGWIIDTDHEKPDFGTVNIFEADSQPIYHYVSIETLFQLGDAFTLMARRLADAKESREAEELEQAVALAAMHQPLPFDRPEVK